MGHRWRKFRFIPWPACVKCGLVKLKNALTEAAVKARCEGDE